MVNKSFNRAFALPEGGIIGRTDAALDPQLADTWRANDEAALKGLVEMEEWNELADGRHVYETAKFPLLDASGRLYAVCGVSLDVTDRRRAAARVVERDAALAANAAKSTFLATMSHEIRTPMNAVIGMTDLLLNTELDARQRECVETVRTSGDSLLALINDVLDFSKIESGDLELEQIPFDIGAEAETTLDLVLSAAGRKGLELVCDVSRAPAAQVLGDVHRVRQIFANLLSNAVKFTERGEILLTVACEPAGENRVRVLASVADTGRGIPPDTVSRLFRSFDQTDASTARLYGGTGLGLAISRRLAEAMGGELRLDITSPEGSTFLLDVTLELAAPTSAAAEKSSEGEPSLSGRSALLVDDNATNLRILDYQLGILGLTCTSFTSPRAALEQVSAGLSYDLAVLDMHMPEMDGVTLGAALRDLPAATDAPLVLLTSLDTKPSGLDRSFSAFLTKPAKRATLHETVLRVMLGADEEIDAAPREPDEAPRALRILLAEDNVVNQRVAKLMLDQLGHEVDIVVNGYEAVAAVTSRPYDVVLMDVQMPEVDGLEATRRIRCRLPRDQVPYLVAMTANARPEDREECIGAGMHDYLSKPVRITELEEVLAKVGGVRARALTVSAAPPVDDQVVTDMMVELGDATGEMATELIDQYLAEGTNHLALLRDVLASGNHQVIRSLSHTWRSTSALVGATQLAALLQELESAAVDLSPTCPARAAEVEQEYAQVRRALLERTADLRAAHDPSPTA
jgi:signal transduction histidine kinase/CheY-like chemotaxis protein